MVILNVNDRAQIVTSDQWDRLLVAAADHVTKGCVAACHPDPETPTRMVKAFANLLEVALQSIPKMHPAADIPDTDTRL